MIIGAQLYTVRDFTKDKESLSETLKKIADIGYTAVQISAVCPFEAEWMKNELAKNGLVAPVRHYSADDIDGYIKSTIEGDLLFGCESIGLGWYGRDYDPYEFIERFKPSAEKIKAMGGKFAFHNHDGEFIKQNGKLNLDVILDAFPKELLDIILDVYWVQNGGADPIYWLKRLEGRTKNIHLKDMAYDHKMAPIGEGNMNFDGILSAAVDTGVKYAFVEQDDCYGEDPFECLKRSYEFLKAKGFN